ncbi:hypothetical protein AADZ90_017370 [Aestuariibius sp. 2305UL40-4]|uniref:hypothetical protein n=1 Tax=Aestuariibius violaceus TaxID=3234132 RepID=UPI00345ECE5E
MPKVTKKTLFKTPDPRPETLLDKTTRAVRQITDDETEQRQAKTERLRNARLQQEAKAQADAAEQAADKPRRTSKAKSAK